MDPEKAVDRARDAITVRRVFGEPYERDGATVVPAAAIAGCGGGGGGEDPESGQQGGGSGFGIHARPVGAYVIEDGRVRWEPATDPTRVILRAQALVGALLLLGLLLRRRR